VNLGNVVALALYKAIYDKLKAIIFNFNVLASILLKLINVLFGTNYGSPISIL